jgi:glycosyltransferase involved in cell wall biosynthesis
MRLLFIPVSGPKGMGEYARLLSIATAAAVRWPRTAIHFVLSGEAPYALETPFPKTLLPSSATFHPAKVSGLIESFKPNVVLFDNAGRTAQLRAAQLAGARIVFISSRVRQRRRAFRLRWMRLIDEHWIAYPPFLAGPLGRIERLKLRLLGRPRVLHLDVVLPPPDPALAAATWARFSIRENEYVLVVPGGGTAHPGAENAPQIFADAALGIAVQGTAVIVIGVPPPAAAEPRLHVTSRLPMATLVELMRGAKLVISNGGYTLLQALACGRPCVAAPIASDQSRRIAKCVQAGVAVGARLDVNDIETCALTLLRDDNARQALESRVASFEIRNGVQEALASIERLSRQS